MKLHLINYNQYVKTLKEVENPKYIENNKFTRDGIFSQQIFGPIKSYYCACNKSTYRGKKCKFSKCPDCGVDVTTVNARKERFARINLPFKVINPLFYFIICDNKHSIKNIIDTILDYKEKYYVENNEIKAIEDKDDKDDKEGKNFLLGTDGVLEFIKIIYQNKTDETSNFINNNFDQIAIEDIIVIPPAFRPCTKISGVETNFILDEINRYYTNILTRSNLVKKLIINNKVTTEYFIFNFKSIQNHVIELYRYIIDKLGKKKGLIRANILGKRVDFSGRAVITPDPELNLDECGIPYWMILEILKPQLSSYIVDSKIKKRYNSATELIDYCINNESLLLFETVKSFCKNKVCILNRQPTLHRLSILGFKVVPHKGKTIKIHPLVCSAYNADFDGDQMALYFPVTKESESDVRNKIGIWRNLLSPTDGDIVAIPNQDIILGIYSLTKESDDDKMVEYKGKLISEGRKLFNECLPKDYPVINRTISKKELYVILNRIALVYKDYPEIIIQTLDKIKKLGFEYSTKIGFTLNVIDMYSKELEEQVNELTGNIKKDLILMKREKISNLLRSLPFAIFIDSGARGSWDQAKQLVFCRGYVADSYNQIRKDLIKTNLINGLTPDDFFNSSYGARKGLLDTATSTGSSGYITRQLIYSTNFIEIADNEYIENELMKLEKKYEGNKEINIQEEKNKLKEKLEDCGCTEYFEFSIDKDPNKARKQIKSIVGRHYLNDDGTLKKIPEWLSLEDEKFYTTLFGKTLKLRSPLYCTNKKICKVCYGDNYKILHSSQIGIVATQAIGERLTQLVLRTFHTSGVVGDIEVKKTKKGASEEERQNKDIISGMTYINRLLHKPSVMFEDKQNIDERDIVLKLYELFSTYGEIQLVHFEIIVSSMLWTKGGNYWRTLPLDIRKVTEKNIESVLKIPSLSSWLIGLAFSNVKTKLIDGIIHKREDVETAISSLFRF